MRKVLAVATLVLIFCIGLAAIGQHLGGKHLRGARAVRRVIGCVFMLVFIYGVLSQTILGRTIMARDAKLELLWSYRAALALTEEGVNVTDAFLFAEILLNVLLFAPFGALLPFLAPEVFGRRSVILDTMCTAAVAGACSCVIELSQWRFHLGLFELDDIMDNTIGAALGYVTYRTANRLFHRASLRY